MIIDPIPIEVKLYKPALSIPNTVDSIRYYEGFDIRGLDPQIGQIFQIFVSHLYLKFDHQPIADQKVYGSTFYHPESDIAALVFHSGALFIHPKLKAYKPVRFSTVKNLFESLIVPESEYTKTAVVIDLPTDLQIQGINVQIYIDQSPISFPSAKHNNYESQEMSHIAPFSLRIIDFNIITMYDDPPHLVSPNDYRRQVASIPNFKTTFTGEIGIEYTPQIFTQIFSKFNLSRNIFDFFYFLFDIGNNRFEIFHISGSKFSILRVIQQVAVEATRLPNVDENSSVLFDNVDITELGAKKHSIVIREKEFGPVNALLLIPRNMQ